jgi:LPXTG-motif cell wall-anchored protein
VTAVSGVSSAAVSWTGGVAGETYAVTPTDLTTGITGGAQSAGTALSLSVSGLTPGHAYTFSVVGSVDGATSNAGVSNMVVPTLVAPGASASGSPTATIGTLGSAGYVTATGTGGTGTVTVGSYPSNPIGGSVAVGTAFVDVFLSPGSTYTALSITVCGTSASVQWWNPRAQAWQAFSNQAAGSPSGCVVLAVNSSTSPAIGQLYGTVLALPAATATASTTSSSLTSLASTGFRSGWLVPVGGAMLLLGAGLLLTSRRRNSVRRRARHAR